MITLLRIAVILFILWLAIRYVRLKFAERLRDLFGGENSNSAGSAQVADMVEDPVCGSFISVENAVKETIKGKERYFCSKECAEKFSEPGEDPTGG
jgi:YHS domain-containing protein